MHSIHHFNVEQLFWLASAISRFPGVPIFFVLSGFLISASLERSKGLAQYLRNRALRIFPGLWACLVVSIVSVAILRPKYLLTWKVLPWLFAQTTVFQFYNPDFLRQYGDGVLNGSLWTISVELQFYTILPVLYCLLALHRRKNNGVLAFITMLCALVNFKFYEHAAMLPELVQKLVFVSFLPHLCFFLFGALMFRNFEKLKPFFQQKFHFWLICYAGFSVLCEGFDLTVAGNRIFPLLGCILGCVAISLAYTIPGAADKLICGNDISYGLYIYHMVVINLFLEMGFAGHSSLVIAAYSITTLLALGSWNFIEKPFLKKKRSGAPSIYPGTSRLLEK